MHSYIQREEEVGLPVSHHRCGWLAFRQDKHLSILQSSPMRYCEPSGQAE